MQPTLTILAERAVLPGRLDTPVAAIDVADGKIVGVRMDEREPAPGAEVVRVPADKVLLPGLIDSHVHLNQPGRTRWEGFATGTRAAVSGGVTTLVDMPLNSIPPTTTLEGLQAKLKAARDTGVACDTAFWGGIVPGNEAELVPLLKAGVRGFKCFLINSGVDEFPHVNEAQLHSACDALEGTNALVIFHAELEQKGHSHEASEDWDAAWGPVLGILLTVALGTVAHASNSAQTKLGYVASSVASFIAVTLASYISPFEFTHTTFDGEPGSASIFLAIVIGASVGCAIGAHLINWDMFRNYVLLAIPAACALWLGSYLGSEGEYAKWLETRPAVMEEDALALVLRAARKYPNLRFHIVHLSAASALPKLRAARDGSDGGKPVRNLTVETCFHYLTLAAEDVPRSNAAYKCCPPVRDAANRAALVRAVKNGEIDYIVSDHSPCTPELKHGGFGRAWGGVSSLGLGLQLLHTHLGIGLPRIAAFMGANQAKHLGLATKGEIRPGCDADFVVFDDNAETTLTRDDLPFRNKVSPYIGHTIRGKVDQTYIRGRKVFDAAKGVVDSSVGELI